jgi:hypothetical protein
MPDWLKQKTFNEVSYLLKHGLITKELAESYCSYWNKGICRDHVAKVSNSGIMYLKPIE